MLESSRALQRTGCMGGDRKRIITRPVGGGARWDPLSSRPEVSSDKRVRAVLAQSVALIARGLLEGCSAAAGVWVHGSGFLD